MDNHLMPGSHLYFAYGSNLSVNQMRERCPSSVVLGPAMLPKHRLLFASHSKRWNGAVATVVAAADRVVPGLLYSLSDLDLASLDRYEGHPHAYRREVVSVQHDGGKLILAQTYYLRPDWCKPGTPSAAYRGVIETAYREWGLDFEALL